MGLPTISRPDFRESAPAQCHYNYLSVREVAPLLQKCPSRLYAMVDEGLLDAVGWPTFRSPNGRIWIAVPNLPEKEVLAESLRILET